VRAQHLLGQRADRREQRDRLQRQPEVPEHDLQPRHGDAAAPEDPQRAHVQRLGDDEPDDDRHRRSVWRAWR
jgi:hypothetical protein